MQDLAVTLEKAADLLDEKGWTKGQYQAPNGSLCMLGAINKANGSSLAYGLRSSIGIKNALWLWSFFKKDHWVNTQHLADFNDRIAKDKRQVTRALRRAAKAWRAEHSS